MSVTTTQFTRKPLHVDAVKITGHNIEEVADWCQGEVKWEESPGNKGTGKKYIKVRVVNPKNPRQTKAFVGDWLLYTEKGYKVYTHKAFLMAFDEATKVAFPREDGDFTVIGPECFVTQDGSVLSWKGTNYVPQEHQTISGEEPDDVIRGDEEIDDTGITPNEVLEEARGEGLQGPALEEEAEGAEDEASGQDQEQKAA